MKYKLSFLFCFIVCSQLFSQNAPSPYQTDLWKDGALITGAVGLNVLGFSLIKSKDDFSEAEINELSEDDVLKVDRWVAGNSSQSADELSYIPFYASFALPFTFLLGENERENFGQISVLYVESMAITGALFNLSAGLVDRSRPLAYDESLPMDDRRESSEHRSFFAGHAAATAAATFFVAKVFHDFNPDSAAAPFVWAGAAAIPAYVGYLRIKAGKHFLTDTVLGYIVGAAAGILVPELHKKKNDRLSVYPTSSYNLNGNGINTHGLGLAYKF